MFALLLTAVVSFPIADAGSPRAVIAPLPAEAPVEVRRAVSELQRVVEKMCGARLVTGAQPGAPVIHIGRDDFVEKAGLRLDELDEDGFVMQTVGEQDLVLAGRYPHGTEFAVYRFLHKYGGVRWYFPTELGECVPRRDRFEVGGIADRDEPSFRSRQWSSAAVFDKGEWERRNLCRARYSFHHNLLHIFVPSKLFDAHPEWFPEIKGQRYRPVRDDAHNWQPCLSNLDAARYAADVARRFFDENPSVASFSIGVNDTAAAGFCECAGCRALDPTDAEQQTTPRGLPNYSNRFFTFANRVAAELGKTRPDKYLGCLAYHVTEPPPSFDVHPRIIPYLTAGRANWTDPAIRQGDQRLIRGWCRKVPVVGIYDYYYGSGFVSPRIFTGLTEQSLKFAHDAGVCAFYAEIYSTWSLDGPKAWVASQLLWNVDQSAEQLADEFCRDLFGRAARPMREYFRCCEQRWLSRPPGSTTMWAGFFDPRQLDLWPPDVCAKARQRLDEAEQLGRSDEQLVRRRIELFSQGFRQTELWSALYHGEPAIRTADDLLKVLDTQAALEDFQRDVIAKSPLHRAPIPFEQRARRLPGASLANMMFSVADQPGADAVLRRIVARRPRWKAEAQAALALGEQGGSFPEKLANPGFEPIDKAQAGEKGAPPGWSVWFRPGTSGETRWTAEAARSGSRGLVVRGAEAGGPLQAVAVQPGEAYVASIFIRGRISSRAHGELVVQWRDETGGWLTTAARIATPVPAGGTDGWKRLALYAPVPRNAAALVLGVFLFDQQVGDSLQIDDASLRKVSQEK